MLAHTKNLGRVAGPDVEIPHHSNTDPEKDPPGVAVRTEGRMAATIYKHRLYDKVVFCNVFSALAEVVVPCIVAFQGYLNYLRYIVSKIRSPVTTEGPTLSLLATTVHGSETLGTMVSFIRAKRDWSGIYNQRLWSACKH